MNSDFKVFDGMNEELTKMICELLIIVDGFDPPSLWHYLQLDDDFQKFNFHPINDLIQHLGTTWYSID